MNKYLCAILTIVMLILVLPMSYLRVKAEEQEKPKFEVILIKPSSPKPTSSGAYGTSLKFLPGGKFITKNMNLNSLISTAYEIPPLQVMDIPKLIEKASWNIEAKPEEGKYPLKEGLLDPHVGNLMIQSMLEDRFKLKVHRETRILPGYELVIAKGGPKLTPAKDPAKSSGGMLMPGSWMSSSESLTSFASALSTLLFLWEGDKNRFHVVDKTGIEGLYDIRLRWTPDLSRAPGFPKEEADQSGITLFEAIQDQLGLKLVPAKIPTPVVVVDDAQMPKTN